MLFLKKIYVKINKMKYIIFSNLKIYYLGITNITNSLNS